MRRCAARSPAILPTRRTPQIPLARVLWLRGFPDQAVECVRPLTGAAAPRDVVMHCIALCWSASLFGWVGDWAAVESMASRLAAHAGMHGLAPYQAVAAGFRAQTLIARGEVKSGIELLRTALPRLHADRYELYASAFVAELSQGLAALGQLPEGLKVLHETIARVEPEGDAFDMPELLRLRGELEARSGDLEGCGSELCGIDRAGRTAGSAVLAAADGDVACPASTPARQGKSHWTVWPKPMPASPKALRRPI